MQNQFEEKYGGRYRIPATRKPGWDYGSRGIYFVTICTKNRIRYFGKIIRGVFQESSMGRSVRECWNQIPHFHPYVVLDAFVVMPDHVHGVICINRNHDHKRSNSFGCQSKNLASIIRGLKSGVTMFARQQHIPFEWQSRYYDRIIHSQDALDHVRMYISNNPKHWIES